MKKKQLPALDEIRIICFRKYQDNISNKNVQINSLVTQLPANILKGNDVQGRKD